MNIIFYVEGSKAVSIWWGEIPREYLAVHEKLGIIAEKYEIECNIR